MRVLGFRAAVATLGAVLLCTSACGSSDDTSTPASAAPTRAVTTATGSPYVVGVMARITGVDAEAYIGTQPSIDAWVKQVNESGGINGHPVKVVVKDTAGDAAKGLAAAKDLVENDKAVALIPDDPSVDNSILSYTQQAGVPVVGAYAAYPIWNATPNWFPLGIQSFPTSQSAAVKIVKDTGATSVVAVVCAEVAACGAVDGVLKNAAPAASIRYDGVLKVSASQPNYTAECLAMKSKNTAVIYMGVSSGVSRKVAADCATQGFKPELFFPFHAFQPGVSKIPGLTALALLPTMPWYADVPATQDFRAALKAVGGLDKADATSMYVWTALEAFKAGAGALGDSPTPAAVAEGLGKLKDFTAGGLVAPITFAGAGKPAPIVTCYFVGGFKDGKFYLPQGDQPTCL
jgi:branched-chain amino acid transport system substrate-binding protein